MHIVEHAKQEMCHGMHSIMNIAYCSLMWVPLENFPPKLKTTHYESGDLKMSLNVQGSLALLLLSYGISRITQSAQRTEYKK